MILEKSMQNVDINEKNPELVWLNATTAPFSLHGVFYDEAEQAYLRMPKQVADSVSRQVANLNYHTAGGRLRFRTDSPVIEIFTVLKEHTNRAEMPLSGIEGFDLYRMEDGKPFLVNTYVPPKDILLSYEKTYKGDGQFCEYTLNFPLYSGVRQLHIGLAPGAKLEAPSAYSNELPVVFYGSSITQGASASRPGTCYENYLSRWFNMEYLNLGFSGACKAEDEMADYIAGLQMKAFVLDYDHNVRNSEELKQHHYPFYQKIRKAHPDLPILFVSAPDIHLHKGDFYTRREVILENYKQAVAEGDKNVWFADGAQLFEGPDRDECSVDRTHPTDLGFYRMAHYFKPILEEMLNR